MNFFSLFKRKILYQLKNKINIDLDGFNKKDLDELFYFYGSDKANFFKKKLRKGHGFSKFYSQNLDHLKSKEIRILEIGSYAGASAAAFIKYFPKSIVHCFDVNISNFEYSSKKIHVHGLDINNKNSLYKIFNKIGIGEEIEYFDLIIDDGSHYLSDILYSLNFFFKYLKKNGIYVIEDFKHPNYYNYNRDIEDILVDKLLQNLIENRNFKSQLISTEDQNYLIKNIKKIKIYKGNLDDSDICFIDRV